MCIIKLINTLMELWDERQHKSREEKLKSATIARSFQKQRDELAERRATLIRTEAKYRETQAGILEVKVGAKQGENMKDSNVKNSKKNEKGECAMDKIIAVFGGASLLMGMIGIMVSIILYDCANTLVLATSAVAVIVGIVVVCVWHAPPEQK